MESGACLSRPLTAIIAAGAWIAVAAPALAQPSYSCSGTLNTTERAICNSADLSRLDRDMASMYYAYRDRIGGAAQTQLRSDQNRWRQARDSCGANAICIAALYGQRIAEIRVATRGPGTPEPQPEPPDAAPQRADNTRVLPDGSLERVRADGSRLRRTPGGQMQVVRPDGTTAGYATFTHVSYAGLPTLPPEYTPWSNAVYSSLETVLRNILTPEEFDAYQQTELTPPKNYFELLDWRIRSISFLTSPS